MSDESITVNLSPENQQLLSELIEQEESLKTESDAINSILHQYDPSAEVETPRSTSLVSAEVLEVKARAIQNRECRGSFAVSNIGRTTLPNALTSAAEELVRLDSLTVAVVLGKIDSSIHVAARSVDPRIDVEELFEQLGHEYSSGDRPESQKNTTLAISLEDQDDSSESTFQFALPNEIFSRLRDQTEKEI